MHQIPSGEGGGEGQKQKALAASCRKGPFFPKVLRRQKSPVAEETGHGSSGRSSGLSPASSAFPELFQWHI